jgi:hypothetical protein
MRRDHVLSLYSRVKDDIGARPKSSPTGEDRLVAVIFGISVDEDGIRVVLLFAIEVRPCFDVVVVCFGAIRVGHGRRSDSTWRTAQADREASEAANATIRS